MAYGGQQPYYPQQQMPQQASSSPSFFPFKHARADIPPVHGPQLRCEQVYVQQPQKSSGAGAGAATGCCACLVSFPSRLRAPFPRALR